MLALRYSRVVSTLACTLVLLAASAGASSEPHAGLANPRALVERFFSLTTAGDYEGAARLVQPSHRSDADLAKATRRLRSIFDQYGAPNLDDISPNPEGDLDDKLPPDRELIPAAGPDPTGPGSLTLVRSDGDAPAWLISRSTIAHVDAWYRTLPSRWLTERLPPVFTQLGPFGLQLWQWLALLAAIVLSVIGAYAFGRLTGIILRRYARRTTVSWDDLALAQLRGPFVFAWLLVFLRALLPLVALPEHAFSPIKTGMRGAFVGTMFWAAIGVVEGLRVSMSGNLAVHPGGRAILGLGGRLLKVVLVLIGIVVIIAEMGFSVTSLVAGIGVGGLGLALAAQKTVENVFGAFSIGIDQPFREGDAVQVDGITGTIERIGLRSTRIRTLDRTLVAIPNGKLAEMRTETLTARDRYRLLARLALRPDAKPATVREVILAAEKILREHEKADTDARARVVAITPTSIDVEVVVSFLTTNFDEFSLIRQEMLLGLLDIIEKAGTSLMPPAQSVQLVQPPAS